MDAALADAKKGLILFAIAATLAACRARQPVAEGWVYSGDTIGLGPRNSEFDFMMACGKGSIIFTTYGDAGFSGIRPVHIDVDGIRFDGAETVDPSDGIASTSVIVPIDHPIISRIARTAKQISFSDGKGLDADIAGGPLLAEFVQNCRAKREKLTATE